MLVSCLKFICICIQFYILLLILSVCLKVTNCTFQYTVFGSWKFCKLYVLFCSNCLQEFSLETVIIAIQPFLWSTRSKNHSLNHRLKWFHSHVKTSLQLIFWYASHQEWLKYICEHFDTEVICSWEIDILRGKFDYNNTIISPVFMFTLIPHRRI